MNYKNKILLDNRFFKIVTTIIVLITICSCSSVEPAKEKTTAHKTTQNLNTTIIDQQITHG